MDVLGGAPGNSGLDMVHYADSIGGIVDWIENPETAPSNSGCGDAVTTPGPSNDLSYGPT